MIINDAIIKRRSFVANLLERIGAVETYGAVRTAETGQ